MQPRPPRPHRQRRSPETPRQSELVQGLRAGLAVYAARREDIARIAFAPSIRHELAELTRWAVLQRVPCQEMSEGELDRLSLSPHHEGLCVVTRPRRWASAGELAEALMRDRGAAIALDRVRNPYNVGAVLRSAAFFGVGAALLGAPAPHPGLAPTAVRVAEGGVEHMLLARTTDLADTLARLRVNGVQVVGADASATTPAWGFRFRRPALLVVGNERGGLGERVRRQCDALVSIKGSGAVESLNVAVATGILLSEMVRRA